MKLKVLLVLAVVIALVIFYPPARLSALALTGRSPECPLAKAVKSDENLKIQIRYKDEILAASKLVQTDPAGYELYETPDGPYWIPAGSKYVLPFNLAEEKRDIYGTGKRAVQPGDTVLDCGANVGVFVRKSLKRGAKKIVAIEPAPENLECLRRNFKNEIEAGQVVVYPKGVWDKDDVLTFNVDPQNSAADSFVIKREGSHTIQVPLTTIDKLVDELKLERVDFIKMDIEGAEPNALRGAKATLQKFEPRMSISVYHEPDHPVTVPKTAREAVPAYKTECGPCAEEKGYFVRPDIMYLFTKD